MFTWVKKIFARDNKITDLAGKPEKFVVEKNPNRIDIFMSFKAFTALVLAVTGGATLLIYLFNKKSAAKPQQPTTIETPDPTSQAIQPKDPSSSMADKNDLPNKEETSRSHALKITIPKPQTPAYPTSGDNFANNSPLDSDYSFPSASSSPRTPDNPTKHIRQGSYSTNSYKFTPFTPERTPILASSKYLDNSPVDFSDEDFFSNTP